jgi:hypothetical protein
VTEIGARRVALDQLHDPLDPSRHLGGHLGLDSLDDHLRVREAGQREEAGDEAGLIRTRGSQSSALTARCVTRAYPLPLSFDQIGVPSRPLR